MSFRYLSHQIQTIVAAKKVVREGQALEFRTYKDSGKYLDLNLDLADGSLHNLEWRIMAGRFDEPESYRAALILDNHRIRGVDFSPIERRRFYRIIVPRGWHQNVIDPNLSSRELNRHVPMADFEVMDLKDFLRKVAQLWHIELELEAFLL